MNDNVATKAKALSIREAVIESVSNVGERTRSIVVEHFAQREADKRAAALVKGLDKLSELEKEGYKIKPTYAGYNEAGEGVGEPLFSKEQVEARKKNREQIEKLTNALNAADDKGDFSKLYDLTK